MKKLFVAVGVLFIITAFEQEAKVKLAARLKPSQPNTEEVIDQVDSLVLKIKLINKANKNEK